RERAQIVHQLRLDASHAAADALPRPKNFRPSGRPTRSPGIQAGH
ncbi:unnamed protein product, partial [Tilletia laevis]